MARHILLLRGINLGAANRISMPELRASLADLDVDGVQTYLQSGNVVLSSDATPARLARECERLIADRFGMDVAVVARSRDELAAVVRRNPLASVAVDPKRYQVTFLAGKLDSEVARKLEAAAAVPEQLTISGREVYTWHPGGVGRSKLSGMLAGRGLGVTATARNWATVVKLLELANA